ncbi:hypothetical protein GCM10011297_24730 [Bacterioplanes sanyensis]|uniref:YjfK family protein n=1 Tax=Bacterioplanes sanyensis TaxID=1249553 RepID=UPI001679EFBF|nr:YjfK family protein [Bacterioplanes sanyensis]GGY50896.1 hypothetical protein GCM10011297_24730 [Bacterioplanes sanyensis]
MLHWFKKTETSGTPEILGLKPGFSFEVDSLLLRLLAKELTAQNIASTQLIQAAGIVEMDDTFLFRYYTDDDAWLQVVTQGGRSDQHVIDVKLFHYYDTLNIATEQRWNRLLSEEIGQQKYYLEQQCFQRVWTDIDDYHPPVAMTETTWDQQLQQSSTDQFAMLFERSLAHQGMTESLFLAAEEHREKSGHLSRCLVISTGITLTPSQLTIYG